MNKEFAKVDDLNRLINYLPAPIRNRIKTIPNYQLITEIVMDLGQKVEVRFQEGFERLHDLPKITYQDIATVTHSIGAFNTDNRAGIEGTLHRISAIRNRQGVVVGLTCRVGRAITGTVELIRDLVESRKSLLFLGSPGIGKTTNLRETARVLADDLLLRVIIIDTSNEIAGDGDIPHPGIGTARRMQVPSPDMQHHVMIEAVENHMPQVIIVDEIGTEEEAKAARTIAERGVQLIATAHGYTLENLIKNPTLSDLVGGIQSVILGDEEAKFRGTQKTVLERKALPTFHSLIEIRERDLYAIYPDIAHAVDHYLRGEQVDPEIRYRKGTQQHSDSQNKIGFEKSNTAPKEPKSRIRNPSNDAYSFFPFGINVETINAVIHSLQLPVEIAPTIHDADGILTVQTQLNGKGKNKLQLLTQGKQIPVHVLKRNSNAQLVQFFKRYFNIPENDEQLEAEALREIKKACTRCVEEHRIVEVAPRPDFLRRIQRQYVEEKGLNGISVGEEPNRRIRIYPKG